MRGLSLVVASGGHSSSRCTGLSLSWPLLLRSTGSRRTGSVIVAHGPSCSTACGIFPDQGSNPCPLHWQADSQPLRHQGSPVYNFLKINFYWSIVDLQCVGTSLAVHSELPLQGLQVRSLVRELRSHMPHSAAKNKTKKKQKTKQNKYNVSLLSAVQQSESVIHVHLSTLF